MASPAQALGFDNSPIERRDVVLMPTTPLPVWLQGVLLRTGPALFRLGPNPLQHWFDGLAKLQRLAFSPGGVRYDSRFLQSQAYRDYRRTGRLASFEFASTPQRPWLRRVQDWLLGAQLTDNDNVNVVPLPDGDWLALSETTRPWRIGADPSLSVQAPFAFRDGIDGQLTTAHPWFDRQRGELLNLVLQLGLRSSYRFTSWDLRCRRRRLVAQLPVGAPAYQHSFAVTARHLVLLESPLRVSPLALRFSGHPYIDCYRWRADLPLRITLLDRHSGAVVRVHELDPGFHFHVVNAFDRDGAVIVELPLFADAGIVAGLRLEALQQGRPLPASRLVRLHLPLGSGTARQELLLNDTVELPRIHPGWASRPHRVAYLAISRGGVFLDGLVKVDSDGGVSHRWQAEGCFPGEPLFVAQPGGDRDNSAREDVGVVLVMVLEPAASRSFLAVLEARDLSEISRLYLPDVVPFSFHGQFRFTTPQQPAPSR